MPRHGEEKHYGIFAMPGPPIECIDGATGELMVLARNNIIESVSETWCEHCQKWIQTDGVIGPLMYMAVHRDGDCKNGR